MSAFVISSAIPPVLCTLGMGMLIGFMGYDLHKIWIAVVAFVFGFQLGNALCAYVSLGITDSLLGLIVAILITALSLWLYDVGTFLLCGCCGLYFLAPFIKGLGLDRLITFCLMLIVFIVLGVLSRKFMKPLVIILTSICGAVAIVSALAELGVPYVSIVGIMGMLCVLIVALIAMLVQFSGISIK